MRRNFSTAVLHYIENYVKSIFSNLRYSDLIYIDDVSDLKVIDKVIVPNNEWNGKPVQLGISSTGQYS